MIIHNFFSGKNQLFAFITAGILFAGLFSCLVISGYWFSYYNSYGKHAEYTVLATYYCTLLCMVFSLLALVVLIFMVVSHFFLSFISENRLFSNIIVIVLTVFSIFSIITGLLCGVLGVTDINPNGLYDDVENPTFDPKCHTLLIDGFSGTMYYYAKEHNDAKGYGSWMYKILKKICPEVTKFLESYLQESELKPKEFIIYILQLSIDEDDVSGWAREVDTLLAESGAKYSNALCKSVGVPSFIFSIFTIVGLVFLAIFGCCAKGDDASENEGA
ncbi:hypothetical protein M9Y10_018491 [Tritrichomonas musculus]|uniref:Tetraspanin family protein n=1 Tax=Tritrichomonas musculus TaxID=1915356 RepID=A0ABR2HMK6_9EUKA